MSTVPNKKTFEDAYAGQAPWDIGKPQKPFIDVADQITGSTLDAGCGTGDAALFFAGRGNKVTGIDFLEEPIRRAKRKAGERGLTATFLVMDALALKDLPEVFDNVIDSGLFHVFSDEDRQRYVDGLATVLKTDGSLFLLCLSDEEPGTQPSQPFFKGELDMVRYAIVFLVIVVLAALLGFGGVANYSWEWVKIIFYILLILAVLSFVEPRTED